MSAPEMNNHGAKPLGGRDCAGRPGPLGGHRRATRSPGTVHCSCRIGAVGKRMDRNIAFGFIFLSSVFLSVFLVSLGLCHASSVAPLLESNPTNVAKLLAVADTWLLPQPKAVAMSGEGFDLKQGRGIRVMGCYDPRLKTDFPALLQKRSGVWLKAATGKPGKNCISLVLCPHETPPSGVKLFGRSDLADLGDQGYCLRVDRSGISAAAATEQGLYYATRTLAQIATGRIRLPGLFIKDWPSLRYRGFQHDSSRGQMPKLESLKRI